MPDIAAALNRVLAARGLAPFSREETTAMIGDGSDRLIARALAARGRPADPAVLADFVADYADHAAVATRLFPGVADMLATLHGQGWRLAVCTNKHAGPAGTLLGALGVLPFIAAIGGADTVPARKPDPAHLLATLAAARGCAARAVMLGDHANDVLSARAAGLPAIFAAWGYGRPGMEQGAAAVARAADEVPDLAARLAGLTAPPG